MKKADLSELRENSGYYDYMENRCEHTDSCLICGRRTKPGTQKFVQMAISGFITDCDIDLGDDSQGCFPVGKTCFRNYEKLAKRYE